MKWSKSRAPWDFPGQFKPYRKRQLFLTNNDKKIGEESFMNHFYNSYFPNHNRAFHINNLQKGVEKNLPGVEGVDFAERGRSTPKGVGVGRSASGT